MRKLAQRGTYYTAGTQRMAAATTGARAVGQGREAGSESPALLCVTVLALNFLGQNKEVNTQAGMCTHTHAHTRTHQCP